MGRLINRVSARRAPLGAACLSLAVQLSLNLACLSNGLILGTALIGVALVVWTLLAPNLETLGQFLVILVALVLAFPVSFPVLSLTCAFALN
jgi:hypothetical protein